MPDITTTTAAAFIPTIWSKEVIRATEANLVLANLVWRFDSEIKKMGNTVKVPTLTNLVANDKVANTQVTTQAPTETTVDILIDKHKETSVLIEDIAEVQANQNLMDLYTQKAGYAIAKSIDSDIAALATGFSQTTGTYNTPITTDVVLDSIRYLDLADVPADGRVFVFRPEVKRDLLDIQAYTDASYIGEGTPVTTGKIGTLYGIPTYMSTNLLFTGGTDRNNMMFHKEALALALQSAPRTQSQYLQEWLANLVTVDTMYGVKEMRDTFGVLVKS